MHIKSDSVDTLQHSCSCWDWTGRMPWMKQVRDDWCPR